MPPANTPVAIPDKPSRGLNVCVFCSANDLDEKYVRPAQELAGLLAKAGHNVIFGGSDTGLMKVIAEGAQAGGAKVTGISMKGLQQHARQGLDELIIAEDLGKRKALLLERSDVLVMLVGGIGTLDEVTEVIEHKKHGRHNKPIIILNTDGFYDGLHAQLRRMETEGFFWQPLSDYVTFTATPAGVIKQIGSVN